MQIYHDYSINCISTDEVKLVEEHFSSLGMEVKADGLRVLIISDESKKEFYTIENEQTHICMAIKDWKMIAPMLNRDFSVEGTIDTSSTAGEYMDFRLDYCDGKFSAMYSDWYQEGDLFAFENYAEFCEACGRLCSEERFDTMKDKTTFIIEKDGGDVLAESVPLIYTFTE